MKLEKEIKEKNIKYGGIRCIIVEFILVVDGSIVCKV
jgi:hypothetical protein